LKKLRHKATEDDIKKACKYVKIDELYAFIHISQPKELKLAVVTWNFLFDIAKFLESVFAHTV
jgi:ABC-type metal ion transport system substrate-binding protein